MIETPAQYRAHRGRLVDQIPKMLEEGIAPLSTAEIALNYDLINNQLGRSSFYTSDLIAFAGKGREHDFKVILTVNNQGEITENGKRILGLVNQEQGIVYEGAISLGSKYDELKGHGVRDIVLSNLGSTMDIVERILSRSPSEVEPDLAYDKRMFETIPFTIPIFDRRSENVPRMRLLRICREGTFSFYSDSSGRVDREDATLVSLGSEAQISYLPAEIERAARGIGLDNRTINRLVRDLK